MNIYFRQYTSCKKNNYLKNKIKDSKATLYSTRYDKKSQVLPSENFITSCGTTNLLQLSWKTKITIFTSEIPFFDCSPLSFSGIFIDFSDVLLADIHLGVLSQKHQTIFQQVKPLTNYINWVHIDPSFVVQSIAFLVLMLL